MPLVGSRGRTSPVEEPRDVRAACSGGLGVRWDEDALRALAFFLGTGCDAGDMAKGPQILSREVIATHVSCVSCTNVDCSVQSRKGLGVLGYSETSLTHFSSQAASDLYVKSSHRFSKCGLQGKLAPTSGWPPTLCLSLASSPPPFLLSAENGGSRSWQAGARAPNAPPTPHLNVHTHTQTPCRSCMGCCVCEALGHKFLCRD